MELGGGGLASTSLFFVVRDQESLTVFKRLDEGLADPESRHISYDQDLMFFAAARRKQLGDAGKIARRLADLGVPTSSVDTLRQTPLFFAAREGNTECATFLIHSKCEVNHRDRDGQTALFYAFRSGHIECVQQLVQCRADLNVKDNQRRTAISFAKSEMKDELEKSLNAQNASNVPGHPDPRGRKAPASLASSGVRKTAAASKVSKRKRSDDQADSPREPETMLEWLTTQRNGSDDAGGDIAIRLASTRSRLTKKVSQHSLPATANGRTLALHGDYRVCVPHVSRAARLRELEREFVLDHYEFFLNESWHGDLQPSDWCSLVNVLYDEDKAHGAIASILAGKTAGHQTLECIYSPSGNGTGVDGHGAPQTVGYVHVYCEAGQLDISHIKVERSHQRKGLGSLLLAASIRHAEQLRWHVTELRLVAVASNRAAISLYKKLGFCELSTMRKPVRGSMQIQVEWLELGRELRGSEAPSAFVQQCESNARECMARAEVVPTKTHDEMAAELCDLEKDGLRVVWPGGSRR
eukprot:TRINITY_DN2878_c0_g2_i1.p1 TRINITY_DN2878_c0_g2~~TRINITY_DN2878_c0_g2_i1.p1  ORF type:complete len:526 (+),score=85.90 TRINITY_DN2878_c0_g2_i1:133-1710(+)